MPTPAELTVASPERPVFVLYLYSRGFLNKAAVEKLGITPKDLSVNNIDRQFDLA